MADGSRAVLVTGAAGGIGGAVVERLERDGWLVHGVDVADADLTTREGNRAVVDAAIERFGRLDAIVPNAGFQHVAPIAEFPEDEWDKLLAVLLTSPFLLAKYAWPALAASGDGRICVIASAHALVASPFKAGYVSAKHGVLGLVEDARARGRARRDPRDRGVPRVRPHPTRRGADRRPGPRPRPARASACSRK